MPDAPTTNRPASAAPVDLELRVTTVGRGSDRALEFELHSPSQAVDFYHRNLGRQPIQAPEGFRQWLYDKLEQLDRGLDVDYQELDAETVERELETVGQNLYHELFSDEMRAAYGEFRNDVNTLLIISDEPWIPWELVKPWGEGFDDDFLGIRFQLTRWLAGSAPASEVRVSRGVCVGVDSPAGGKPLPNVAEELELVGALLDGAEGVEKKSLPEATTAQLREELERGGLGLLHFVGHGEHGETHAGEARIRLADRAFEAAHLVGRLQLRLKADRPLVFLNACRVARQGVSLTGLDGWAERWVRGCGCGAFLGPQWEVEDQAACRFAELFYRELEAGHTFGEAVQTARRTVSEEMPERTAWPAYTLYAHPNARLRLGADAPATVQPSAGVPAEIRGGILDFGRFITEKTDGFVGRGWLFDRIETFFDQHSGGYFLLRGDPGIGKSALAAELVRRRGYFHHFNIRAEGINRAEDFLANVCAQLIAAYGLPHSYLPPEATRDGQFLKKLLEEVATRHPGEKLVLVVDALDEAVKLREGVNPVYLPVTVPDGVYVVATARRGTHLRVDCELDELEIEQDDEGNLADVQAFVESWLERPGIRDYLEAQELDDDTFVTEMVDKSQGNFMYLRYVLPEIARRTYEGRDFADLPKGLEKYYEDHWRRMRARDEKDWFDRQLPVLVVLAVVKEPVSVDLIADFSGVDRRRIRAVLAGWDPFLYAAEVEGDDGERQKRYRLYHASFQEFIEDKDEVAGEGVDLKKTHGDVADVLWKELYGDA